MKSKNVPQAQSSEKISGSDRAWDRALAKFGAYFESKGLVPSDIPAAIVVHEVLGMFMAAGMWALCYALQPSRTLARPLLASFERSKQHARAQQAYSLAMNQATKTLSKMSWLQGSSRVDPGRLTTSLAESLCARAALKPATFVFKLWASYQIVAMGKRHFTGKNTTDVVRRGKVGKDRKM